MPYRTCLRVENVKAVVFGSGPNKAFGVDQQRAHPIAGQRLRLPRIVPVLLECFAAAFPSRHASALRRKPKIAMRVLRHRPDVVAGERMFVATLAAKLSNAITIVTIQPRFRRKPNVPL